jgi:hypothetical protein
MTFATPKAASEKIFAEHRRPCSIALHFRVVNDGADVPIPQNHQIASVLWLIGAPIFFVVAQDLYADNCYALCRRTRENIAFEERAVGKGRLRGRRRPASAPEVSEPSRTQIAI